MFYFKPIGGKKTKYYDVKFTSFQLPMNKEIDESMMALTRASMCYNFKTKSGALECGHGFCELKLPMFFGSSEMERTMLMPGGYDIQKVWQYKYFNKTNKQKEHIVLILASDGHVYLNYVIGFSNETYRAGDLTFTSLPNACNYSLNGSDVMIFTSPTDSMQCFSAVSSECATIATAPCLTTMCVHAERLFAVAYGDGRTLRFSDDLDPMNWTASLQEGGYIQFADELGEIGQVVSLGDYLYLIRDYGITRVSAFGSQEDFTTSNVYLSSSKIFPSSCACTGDAIMFLAKDGIYTFDGCNAKRIDLGIGTLLEGTYNEKAVGAIYQNSYFLALKLNFNDGEMVGCETGTHSNNALIEIDLKKGEWNITRGVDICSMTAIEEANASKLVACFGSVYQKKLGQLTNDGKLFGAALKKKWQSPKTNVGEPNTKKFIEKIIISTSANITIKVEADSKTITYSVAGSEKPQIVHPKIVCEKLRVSFESEAEQCHITWPKIVVGVIS